LHAGVQHLRGVSEHGVCTIELTVPSNLDDIPDLGTQLCRTH